LIAFLYIFPYHCYSQHPPFQHYTFDNGLPSNVIYQITQDSKGYIWVATDKGASKFDGSRFENFTIQNGLPENEVLMVIEDKLGRIWFKLFTGPMAYYADGMIHNSSNTAWLKQLAFNHFAVAFTPLYNGDVLISTNEKNIYVLKDTTLQIYKPLFCYDIFEKKDSTVLITQANNFIDDGKYINASVLKVNIHSRITSYYNCVNDILLIVADTGMYCYQHNKLSYLGNQKSIKNKNGCVIVADREGYFWNTDNTNLYRFKIDTNAMLTDVRKYFDGISINNIYQDKDKNFWFATKGEGLLMVPSLNIKLFNKSSGLQDNNITAALRMNDGRIICGTTNDFMHIIDAKNKIENTVNLNAGEIRKIINDGSEGAYILSQKKLFLQQAKALKNLCTFAAATKSLAIGSNGAIIAGGFNGFTKYKNGKSQFITFNSNWGSDFRIYSICEKATNEIWIGTEKGLFIWQNDSLIPFHHEIKSFAGWIDDISKTMSGAMLVTTRYNGLAIIKDDKIKFINTANGLQSKVCTSLYYDSTSQKIYLGLNNGLSVITMNKETVVEIKNYNPSNGLLCGSIFSVSAGNGEILLSTDKGLLIFNESDLNVPVESPKVYITQLEINNTTVDWKSNHTLAYDENNIRITYNGISFRDAKSLQYRYRLIASDKGWNTTFSNSVVYSGLMPGTYNFAVQVRTGNGVWVNNQAIFSFTINKPYWTTWWFRLLIISLIAAIVYSLYRYQLKKKLEQHLAIAADRARIGSEMHDDLGSGLSKISFLSDMINHDSADSETKLHLENISRSSKEMVEQMGNIIWSMNEKNDQLNNLIAYIRKYAVEFFENTSIKYVVNTPEFIPPIIIEGITRRNIFLVVKESLHNVLKHSNADVVKISFEVSAHIFYIIIHDNGIGINSSKSSVFGNGLINMAKRMKEVDGKFSIKHIDGTRIEILIPIKK
jgi:signal transduction histidine kinase/ligand-binding sensor domain-containing protein